MKKLLVLLSLFVTFALAAPSSAQTKILIIGESVSWGCVGNCAVPAPGTSYVDRLQTLLGPTFEVRTVTYFGSGVGDWEPEAPSFTQSWIPFPSGQPYGLGGATAPSNWNLWSFLGRPHLRDFQPDYVLTFATAGDYLRYWRGHGIQSLTAQQVEDAMRRLTTEIVHEGAVPVLMLNTRCAASAAPVLDPVFTGYQQAIDNICNENPQFIKCGPRLLDFQDNVAHFVGGDGIHPNAAGHEVMAQQIAAWFLAQ